MTSLGSNIQAFIKNPDSYYLYTKNDSQGHVIVNASKRGIKTWLLSHLSPWRSYNLTAVMTALERCTSKSDDFLEKLKTKVSKYNEKHSTIKIDLGRLFPSSEHPSTQPQEPVRPTITEQKIFSPISATKYIKDAALKAHPHAKQPKPSANKADENSVIDLSTLSPLEGMNCAKKTFLYQYCAQDSTGKTLSAENRSHINDYGWGCAWRAIQTCLSPLVGRDFEKLYYFFGQAAKLEELYKDKHKKNLEFSATKHAPHDISSGWAEPFIGEMVLHGYGYNADLFCVNGIPSANSPDAVFKNIETEPLRFEAFQAKLNEHFSKTDPVPVMIDNGTYAMNIIGCKINPDKTTTLWISDTHIKGGCNNEETKTPIGIYCVTLNEKGKKLFFEPHDQRDTNRLPEYMRSKMLDSGASSSILDFASQSWMILFPGKRRCLS
jgi:hypothetical protein